MKILVRVESPELSLSAPAKKKRKQKRERCIVSHLLHKLPAAAAAPMTVRMRKGLKKNGWNTDLRST